MGLAILLQVKQFDKITLAREMSWLGIFGIIHGFAEWGVMFTRIKYNMGASLESLVVDQMFEVLFLSASFLFLFHFGVRVIVSKVPRFHLLTYVSWTLLAIWVGNFIIMGTIEEQYIASWIRGTEIWSRYFLCFPGAVLASVGFFAHKDEVSQLAAEKTNGLFWGVSASFLFYGIVAGLVNPYAAFPLNFVHSLSNSMFAGALLPILRSLTGAAMAFFSVGLIRIFYQEYTNLLETGERKETLAKERERISQDLHDGVIQSLYAIGLETEEVIYLTEESPSKAKAGLHVIIDRLNSVILDIRFFIQDLKMPQDYERDLKEGLEAQLQRFSYITQIHGKYSFSGVAPDNCLTVDQSHQLHFIVQEVLANVAKHAEASQVSMNAKVCSRSLSLVISDDGRGIDEVASSKVLLSGNGIQNIRSRVMALKGQVSWRSSLGGGTSFELTIPLAGD